MLLKACNSTLRNVPLLESYYPLLIYILVSTLPSFTMPTDTDIRDVLCLMFSQMLQKTKLLCIEGTR